MSLIRKNTLNIGFVVNPYAGAGGPAGLKGSDSPDTKKAVVEGLIPARSPERAEQFLSALSSKLDVNFVCVSGAMGQDVLESSAVVNTFKCSTIDYQPPSVSGAEDTQKIVASLVKYGVDLIVFVGGDGTARDVCSVVGESLPVVGVPSGVKMHSGVFAITPLAAAKIVDAIMLGKVLSVSEAEVRDIDEEAFQSGRVKSRYYGSMLVPDELRYIQNVKQGGVEVDELVLLDIAAEIRERLEDAENDKALVIFAGGSTCQSIQTELGCPGTLLGIDVYQDGTLRLVDASAPELESLLDAHNGKVILVLTAIGGQGHILGRGNQQLTPSILRRVSRKNVWIVATKEKLNTLNAQPLLMDSNDPELDAQWQGLITIITGYQDQVLYQVGIPYE